LLRTLNAYASSNGISRRPSPGGGAKRGAQVNDQTTQRERRPWWPPRSRERVGAASRSPRARGAPYASPGAPEDIAMAMLRTLIGSLQSQTVSPRTLISGASAPARDCSAGMSGGASARAARRHAAMMIDATASQAIGIRRKSMQPCLTPGPTVPVSATILRDLNNRNASGRNPQASVQRPVAPAARQPGGIGCASRAGARSAGFQRVG
jgi:hypothetical protein